ncbi:MAG: endonuclease III domain-containing protein [Thermodesulfobacteriota bacterium]
MNISDVPQVIKILKKECALLKTPYVTIVADGAAQGNLGAEEESSNIKKPFKVLVSCILSLRTKDEVTRAASERLFALAATPAELAALTEAVIEKAIYPAGFYKTKAKTLREIARILRDKYASVVPDTIDELLKFRGVGRKTANLVVTLGYGKPGICVDTHVHRITNRWGLVVAKTPEKTEFALREILPQKYWIGINDLLVTYGQNICRPTSPFCSRCSLAEFCDKRGLVNRR